MEVKYLESDNTIWPFISQTSRQSWRAAVTLHAERSVQSCHVQSVNTRGVVGILLKVFTIGVVQSGICAIVHAGVGVGNYVDRVSLDY